MSERGDLLNQLEAYYRDCGWRVSREGDYLVAADGPGGVTWHGLAVVTEDLEAVGALESRLGELAQRRMNSGGELCPLDLLPADGCEAELQAALERTRLHARPHVSVYALAAAA